MLLPAWKLPCHDANSNKPEQEGICSRPTRPPFSPWSSSQASLSSVVQCKMKTPRWTAGGKSSALDPLYHRSLGKEKAKEQNCTPSVIHSFSTITIQKLGIKPSSIISSFFPHSSYEPCLPHPNSLCSLPGILPAKGLQRPAANTAWMSPPCPTSTCSLFSVPSQLHLLLLPHTPGPTISAPPRFLPTSPFCLPVLQPEHSSENTPGVWTPPDYDLLRPPPPRSSAERQATFIPFW